MFIEWMVGAHYPKIISMIISYSSLYDIAEGNRQKIRYTLGNDNFMIRRSSYYYLAISKEDYFRQSQWSLLNVPSFLSIQSIMNILPKESSYNRTCVAPINERSENYYPN